jgi:uncharacterized protein (TIGR02145 family)
MKKILFRIIMVLSTVIIFFGCEPDEPPVVPVTPPILPKVSTVAVKPMDNNTFNILSTIISDGGAEISEAGICWNRDTLVPTILGGKKEAYGVKMGDYNLEINVAPGKMYTVRSYAKNSVGLAYGECITFTVDSLPPPPPPDPVLPQISGGTMVSRTSNSAYFTGAIIDTGYCEIIEAGVCWTKTGTPYITDSRTSLTDLSLGDFSTVAHDLEMLTNYRARVYVTNEIGTAYGALISFYTYDSVVDADGNSYYGVKIGSQVWLTENLKTTHFNNGDAIHYVVANEEWQAHANPAYCWYNNEPTRADQGFGALYNLKVVTDSTRTIAPTGYRIPSKEDVMVFGEHFGLEQYVVDENGDPFQYIYTGASEIRSPEIWVPHFLRGNNSTGFSAIPTGFRFIEGTYVSQLFRAFWWTTDMRDPGYHWTFYTGGESPNDHIWLASNPNGCGMGIRCVKDF